MSRAALLIVLAIAAISGCSFDPEPLVAPVGITCPAAPVAAGEVLGPASGTLTSGTSVLEVPAGAVPAGTTLTMTTVYDRGREICKIGPEGQQLQAPATLTMRKPWPRDLNAVYHLFRWDGSLHQWVDVGGTDQGDVISKGITIHASYEIDEVE